jgi:hypothetical protein
MIIFGLFAYYDKGTTNNIQFFSVDEIYDRIPNAKDWTSKLVTGNRIDNITFTFQDYAQTNRIRYMKDNTAYTYADGYIKVDNQTLEKEKEIAELKFAASYQYFTSAVVIPLYGRNENGEIEYNKTTDRIVMIHPGEANSIAAFPAEMYFRGYNETYIPGRINTYYQKYQEILLRPKVIEATFLLNELDIYNIDLLTPVYLEQTGQYYAIIDINVSDKGAKCKLLQM